MKAESGSATIGDKVPSQSRNITICFPFEALTICSSLLSADGCFLYTNNTSSEKSVNHHRCILPINSPFGFVCTTHHPGGVDVINGGGHGLGMGGGGGLHRLDPGIDPGSREFKRGEKPLLDGHGASSGMRSGCHGGTTAAAWRETGVGVGDCRCHGNPHFLHYHVLVCHCSINQGLSRGEIASLCV